MTYEYIGLNIINGKININDKEFILPNYDKCRDSFSENTCINHRFKANQLSLLGKYQDKLYFILEEYSDDYGNTPIYIFDEMFNIL